MVDLAEITELKQRVAGLEAQAKREQRTPIRTPGALYSYLIAHAPISSPRHTRRVSAEWVTKELLTQGSTEEEALTLLFDQVKKTFTQGTFMVLRRPLEHWFENDIHYTRIRLSQER